MAKTVCVTKVTVEYVVDTKKFTVEFDPMKVGSIFFDEKDRAKAQPVLVGTTGPVKHSFVPGNPIPPIIASHPTHVKAVKVETTQPATGPSLWWHTSDCTWFHPEG